MDPAMLTYRPFQERDLPGLLQLWESSGWGALDEATWRRWYQQTPHGPCLLIVALDAAGTVAGQMVFAPAVVDAAGRSLRALRLSSPILRGDVRGINARRVDHPTVRLFFTGMDAAAQAGYDLIYALPDRAWLAFFRWEFSARYFTTAEFACAVRPFAASHGAAPQGVFAETAHTFGDEYSALWEAARQQFPIACGIEREQRWLQWRLGGHTVVAVREDEGGPLLGYAAVRRHDGLLMDALAATPEALEGVLAAALDHLATTSDTLDGGVDALKVMRVPALAPTLDALGFEPDPYRFVFASCPLTPAAPQAAASPERWYVMPGD